MPIFPIAPAGQYGIISDLAPHELPLNAWSGGENVHFAEGYAEKVHGYRNLFGGASVTPYFLASVRPITGNAFWVYAGETAVYCYDSGHHNITRASGAYSSSGKLKWQGGVLNGLLYLNNAVDVPQIWNPAQNTQLLIDLPNWPADTTAAVIRNFKNFMVAVDVTESSVRDARKILWSHPAPAGSYPTSWDITDATKDAGEYSLSETEGILKDSVPLRDVNVLYKDDSVWGMSYVGGVDIFRFFAMFRNLGTIGKNCAVEYQTGKHLVFARDDIFIHDGQVPVSILREKVRKAVYNNLDATNAEVSFIALDSANAEAWICYPETGQTYCNKALVWNWRRGTFGFKDLPGVSSIGIGIADEYAGADTWAAATVGSWNGDAAEWGQASANPAQTRLVAAVPTGNKLQGYIPDTSAADGAPFTASLQRTGLGVPFDSELPPDITSVKFFRGLWPLLTGTAGGVVQIRVGTQMEVTDDPVWGEWQDFIIGTSSRVDILASGRMFGVEFRSTTAIQWKLQGYSIDVEKLGAY